MIDPTHEIVSHFFKMGKGYAEGSRINGDTHILHRTCAYGDLLVKICGRSLAVTAEFRFSILTANIIRTRETHLFAHSTKNSQDPRNMRTAFSD
jgi:hypothetical protein